MTCAELTAMSPSEVDAMTKADIITAIFEGVTRTDAALIQENGDNVELTETTTDAYEVLLGSRVTEWTYYGIGEVDEITVTNKDDGGATIDGYIVKHYQGTKQPTISYF